MRKSVLIGICMSALLLAGCVNKSKTAVSECSETAVSCDRILPLTGSFINLPYQDVRNRYTNPLNVDGTDPLMWKIKVDELHEMGMEYLIIMAVANEGKSYYPSALMPWQYPSHRQSPVDAIMEAAAENGMKVFMSTGWAKDQDDNLRDPKIKGRQLEMMEELSRLYGSHPAMYGWYLPVEDCLGPVLSDYAVDAVNALSARARELTPGKKILISPYGIFNSDFSDPRYEQQICRLKVDIIAYQDEIGCVRERYPMVRLKSNWKKLRQIHDKAGIQMWANCESFAWEGNTNDRTSALVPASFHRFLSQMALASEGGVDRIVSFMMYGIYENPSSPFCLGQPHWSAQAWTDYMTWLHGDRYWKTVENAFLGRYGAVAQEDPSDVRWTHFSPGYNEMVVELPSSGMPESVFVRMLSCRKDGIVPPGSVAVYTSKDGTEYVLDAIVNVPQFPNDRHDAYVVSVLADCLDPDEKSRFLKIGFTSENRTAFDRVILNP